MDHDPITGIGCRVEGVLPDGLSGRYLRIGPEPARSVRVPGGGSDLWVEAVSLRAGGETASVAAGRSDDGEAGPGAGRPASLCTEPPGDGVPTLLEFGGRVLVLREGELAQELGPDLRPAGRVDLAGRGQTVGPCPTLDPATGELHLLASPGDPAAAHQVISRGALTRRTRPLPDGPAPIHHLAVTEDRVVLFADGATGIADRRTTDLERVRWFRTPSVAGPDVVAAHDDDGSVVLVVGGAGRAPERWVLDPGRGTFRTHRIDAAPLRHGCTAPHRAGEPVRHLYGVGAGGQILQHDLRTGRRGAHAVGPRRRVATVTFVPDPIRAPVEAGGWLLAVVDDRPGGPSSLLVLDAADLRRPCVASVRLPGPVRGAQRGLWSAS